MSKPFPSVSSEPAGNAPAVVDPAANVERRFSPAPGREARIALGLIGAGCLGLGAAVFGLWVAPEPIAGSGWILLGGLVVGVAGLVMQSRRPPPVRVGALGITVGEAPEAVYLPWCDVQRIGVQGSELRVETAREPLRLRLDAHGRAAARIVAEAARRIGSRLELSPRAHERLPALSEADGEIVPAARPQLAGRKCLASGTSLTFEADARLCEQCAALYHRAHVPAECKSCGQPLSGHVRAAG